MQHLGGTESSTDDHLDRLTRVSYADGGTPSYPYDAVGHRLSKVEGAASTSYPYDAADRLTAAGSMTYGWDAAGRLTSATAGGTTTSSCWDALDRLTGVADQGSCPVAPPTSFTYRGDGLRASKTVGGTTTSDTWDVQAGRPVVLQDGTFSYVYGLGLISQTDSSGNQTSFLADGLGSTRALTDGSGNVVATSDDDVFGAVRASTGSATSAFRFTGQRLDPSTSRYYLRARSDDPAVGRFLSRDPFPGLATLPAGQHPYAYAHASPLDRIAASAPPEA